MYKKKPWLLKLGFFVVPCYNFNIISLIEREVMLKLFKDSFGTYSKKDNGTKIYYTHISHLPEPEMVNQEKEIGEFDDILQYKESF